MKTRRLLLLLGLLCVFASSLGHRHQHCRHQMHGGDEGFSVHLDDAGNYNVMVNGKVWLTGLPAFVTVHGQRQYVSDMTKKGHKTSSGTDNIGSWNSVTDVYAIKDDSQQVGFSFRAYQGYNMVIMSQEFYTGLAGSSVGDRDAVCTGFPRFMTTPGQENLGYLAYGGIMVGDTEKHMGRWGNASGIASGRDSGPLVLFNHDSDAIIISPFSNFMAASATYDIKNNSVSWGLLGNASAVPSGFQYSTIVFYTNKGIQNTILQWGDVMRKYYGRTRAYTKSDMSNNYLGYWTDNGAYYYYLTEKGMNYEQTLINYVNYSKAVDIPYRYVQYDSWWYPKGQHLGVTEWTAMPEVFPHGLQALYNELDLPVVAHNRFWSDKAVYAKQNGGKYNFTVETEAHLSIPLDQGFWDFLMTSSKLWGLVVYEQDWLNTEFDDMVATTSSVLVGRTWLMQMGKAAAKAGINIQYCMSPSRAILQALEIDVVSQARVSDDYQPGNDNWRIGISSMLSYAIGPAPFKDNFWTTEQQPGNVYNKSEPNSVLQSVVATLSTGPVGPGDKINHSDVKLIMKSCNADGLLLKPSRPAFAIDAQIKQAAFKDGSGPEGEVWTTFSEISGFVFGIILAAAMPDSSVYKLGSTDAMFPDPFPSSIIFAANPVGPSGVTFNDSNPVKLEGCTRQQPCVYYTTPYLSVNGRTVNIYGEVSKWVPMSGQRVRNMEVTETDILLHLHGAVSEQVTISWTVDNSWQEKTCTIAQDGSSVLSLMNKLCISLSP